MQMVPPQLDVATSSDAEKQVFEMLSALEIPGWTYCFHSVNLPAHQYKRACEIDFLLLGERGLLVLEVKGGGVDCSGGIWRTRTRRGGEHRLQQSPFKQAETARIQLERQLRERTSSELVRDTVIGHGVVFPEVDFDIEGIEWAPEMVIDRSDMSRINFYDALQLLSRFWEKKDQNRRRLTPQELERYREAIRPTFDLVPTLRHVGDRIERDLDSLTKAQYKTLDECSRNERLVIDGGAGTGKTMLAAELARRVKAAGAKVVITCRSNALAAHFRRQDGIDEGDVIHFDALKNRERASVDMLIVDEAQDVISELDLRSVDRVLARGLADGRWVMLLDSNNQAGLVGKFEEAAMRRLTHEIRAAQWHLNDNCRNTTEIVEATRERTQADLGTTTAGHGEPVQFIQGTLQETADQICRVLDRLESEASLSHVTLLSPFDLRDSVFHLLPGAWRRRIDRLDLTRSRRLEPGRLGFSRVDDFKGLESRYVLLESPPMSDPLHSLRTLYVGMSRARASLWVASAPRPEGWPQ
jgi:Cdc6-like AAA superfamily ATPase